jgi:methyltransferase (TIGR00027 family)
LGTGEPSRTAQGAALYRAAHQILDRPLVFDDPVALRILGAQRVKQLALELDRFQTPSARAMRAFLVMRSRYVEDELAHVHKAGTTQYLVLGAGLDTFAYRSPYGRRLRVFEIDHPSTQEWKRARLAEQGIELPCSLTFVPVDFEKDSLADRLRCAGFMGNAPVFISWLGVTMYLTQDAVMQTLRFVAESCARGSEIVFDFSLPDEALGEVERGARARRAELVARVGEPWITHFDPASLSKQLTAMGFSQATVIGAREANQRYFADRSDGFSVRGSGCIMTARV